MRDYQPKKCDKDIEVPSTVYNRVIDFIRDFERIKNEYDEILLRIGGYSLEGGGGGGGIKNSPTEAAAFRRIEKWKGDIEAMERAIKIVPKEYRQAIISKCLYDRYGVHGVYYASERTLRRWKMLFIYKLAVELDYI